MSEQVKEESQKTVVSFVVGLLVGGLLVWAFAGNGADAPKDDVKVGDEKEMTADENADKAKTEDISDEKAADVEKLPVGTGAAKVEEAGAGMTVALDSATFPTKEGWVGVRNMSEGKLGMLLGVARFSEEQGLVPKEIQLLTPTVSGREYAIVFYSESGDRKFNLADDIQIDEQFATFTAK